MTTLNIMIKRNVKLFFKDKGMFFTSLITPLVLLVLYATFLAGIYEDSFVSGLPQGVELSKSVVNGLVGGQLVSSILAVSCITVSFCSNFLMVQDKANGTIHDLKITPVKASTLSLSYYVGTLISTMLICFVALGGGLAYVAAGGWYLSAADVWCLVIDTVLLVFFGTAISSVINYFLSTQGQISAVGSIISSCYGFICGAYMPVSSFGDGLRKVISFLPGTYGTSLMRNHALRGVLAKMEADGIPEQVITSIKDAVDCNVYFSGEVVPVSAMYGILGGAVLLLMGVYILLNTIKKR